MNIPIANPELQDLYKKNRNEHLAHQRNNAINNREPKSEVLTSEILLIQKEAAMDPENTNDEKEKHLRRDMRKKHIDDAITRAIAREYTTDEKNPVRILGIEDVSQGELLNVTMINNKSYAVVKSAKYADKSGKKTVPEIVLAEISPQNTKNMIYKIGTEIIVEKPFVGHNHEIEYVERTGGNTRSR